MGYLNHITIQIWFFYYHWACRYRNKENETPNFCCWFFYGWLNGSYATAQYMHTRCHGATVLQK